MTENKRFKRYLLDGGFWFDEYVKPVWSITDTQNKDNPIGFIEFKEEYKDLCDDVVNELNNLHEENELLKKEILWWKYRCGEDISKDIETDKIVRKLSGADIPYGSYTDKEYEKGLEELLKPKTLNCIDKRLEELK